MDKLKKIYPLLLIIFVGILSYSNSLSGPFVFDDAQNIVEQEIIHLDSFSLSKLTELKTGLSGVRPVAMISFAINYYFGKLNPLGYHMVNLLIHLLTAVFVYLLLHFTLNLPSLKEHYGENSTKTALITSLIFVTHPIQTQAVTYIVQRMASLAAMFFILAMYCYTKARSSTGKARILYFSATGLATLLAFGSKETAITLPIFILLYEYYFHQNQEITPAKKKKIYIAFGLTILVSLLAGIYYLGPNPLPWLREEFARFAFTPSQRMLTQLRVVIFYISLLIAPLPSRLNLDHDFPLSYSLLNPPTTLICLLLILGLIIGSIYLRKKRPLISFALIWFWGNLILESSFLPLDMVFEHRLYLPSIGLFLLAALALAKITKLAPASYQPQALSISTIILITLLGMGTFIRNKTWTSEISLWSDVAKKSPNKARAHNNLGSVYSEAKQFDLALMSLNRALEIKPDFVQALYNIGLVYHKTKQYNLAEKPLQQALKLAPKQARIYHALGDVLYDQKKWDKAIELYQQAVDVEPKYTEAYYNLGTALRKTGHPDKALQVYKRLEKLKPNKPEVYLNIGRNQLQKKFYSEALTALQKALALRQNYIPAHYELGKLYFVQGKNEAAVKEFAQVIKLNPKHLGGYYNLGLSYQNLARYDEAVKIFSKALKIDPKNAGIYKNMGIIYLYHLKDKSKALKHLKRSLELDPKQQQAEQIKKVVSTLGIQ